MPETACLTGYKFSVYTRVAKMALQIKGVDFAYREVNPFEDLPDGHDRMHPFGRVPVLRHREFCIYETAAITRYVDRAFEGPELALLDPQAAARMDQVISIVDHYGYKPMVRQVFAQAVFRPLEGLEVSADVLASGLVNSQKVLAALDDIAAEKLVLRPGELTLADCHLAPMMDYFLQAAGAEQVLAASPCLESWWRWVQQVPALIETRPGLSGSL